MSDGRGYDTHGSKDAVSRREGLGSGVPVLGSMSKITAMPFYSRILPESEADLIASSAMVGGAGSPGSSPLALTGSHQRAASIPTRCFSRDSLRYGAAGSDSRLRGDVLRNLGRLEPALTVGVWSAEGMSTHRLFRSRR
jgi:hypothetical protein